MNDTMKHILLLFIILAWCGVAFGQNHVATADSLKRQGLLMPALMSYMDAMAQTPRRDISYQIASTAALLWTSQMRDTSFHYLSHALQEDSTLEVLYDPHFLSLIDDPRWTTVEDAQIRKYEAKHEPIRNGVYARELFRMIIKDQGFMYAGNIERRAYMRNGGYFRTPAIFPVLAMEERNLQENQKRLLELLDTYGWPTPSEVTELAAAGAALIINHTTYEIRARYFPMLEKAFKQGEAQPLLYAKMADRLRMEEGNDQWYGTQVTIEGNTYVPYPILDPEHVDKRRAEIGLGPLKPYLKERFDIDWDVAQKD